MKTTSQFQIMTEFPVPALIFRLALPAITSMMITNIYNMADTAFIGTLGNSASGAVGIVFGLMALIQSIGFLFGQGSGSIISRSLGKKDETNASTIASMGFFFSFCLGLLFTIFGLIFLQPLIMFLGSTETIAPYAKCYGIFILATAPFLASSFTLNNILRFEGKAFFGMIGLSSGAILNIAGDALFIFVFKMGITGAGLSTAISMTVSFGILISSFLRGKTICKISIKNLRFNSDHAKKALDIIFTGSPSLFRQGLSSIATIVLNQQAAYWGFAAVNNADAAVAAMSIVNRIFFFIFSISIGVGQGYQPVCGFNYGAQKTKRLRQAFWFTTILAQALMLFSGAIVFIFAPHIVRLFRDDALVAKLAAYSLRVHCIGILFLPLGMTIDMTMQSTGRKIQGILVSSFRSGIIFIPVILIMGHLRGLYGILESQPVTFMISLLPSGLFGLNYFRYLKKIDSIKNY